MELNKKLIAIASAALILTGTVAVVPTMAYFTDTSTAKGTAAIAIEDTSSKIYENGSGQTKEIVVSNEKAVDCYTRVKVILPSGVEDAVTIESAEGENWTYSDGYYYYSDILPASGEETSYTTVLTLQISVADNFNKIESIGVEGGKQYDFNVIVIPESTKVLYDANGNAYADWSQTYEEVTE